MGQEKFFYTISELSEMFDTPQSTIRFWESEIAILNPKRISGIRKYTSKDIDNFRIAYNLIKVKGLKVSAVNRHLASKPVEHEDIRAQVIERLEKIKASLQQTLYYLEDSDCEEETIIKFD